MAISSSPIQDTNALSPGSGTAWNFTVSAASAGNVLIFNAVAGLTTQGLSSLVQTNVTWSQVVRENTLRSAEIWIGIVAGGASGTNIAITTMADLATAGIRGECSEWSGVATSGFNDVSQGASGASTNPTTATLTPTSGLNELFIATLSKQGGSLSSGPTNSFTALGTSNTAHQSAYRVVASTSGTYATDWTYSVTGNWECVIASFKAAVVAGGTSPYYASYYSRVIQEEVGA